MPSDSNWSAILQVDILAKYMLLLGWNDTAVCDDWMAYSVIKTIQRCWAHLIWEARDLREKNPDSGSAAAVLERLRRIFCNAKGKRPAGERQETKALLVARVKRLRKGI